MVVTLRETPPERRAAAKRDITRALLMTMGAAVAIAVAVIYGEPSRLGFGPLGAAALDPALAAAYDEHVAAAAAAVPVETSDSSWCVDNDLENCATWAGMGECDKNPAYMLAACAKSCGCRAKPPPADDTPECVDRDKSGAWCAAATHRPRTPSAVAA